MGAAGGGCSAIGCEALRLERFLSAEIGERLLLVVEVLELSVPPRHWCSASSPEAGAPELHPRCCCCIPQDP